MGGTHSSRLDACRDWTPGPLRATAVRAVVEVAMNAAASNERAANRHLDLGDLLLAFVEGWPEDLIAHALA